MADVTKRFRWGPRFEKMLDHFSTPEINALRRHCRKLIRDYRNLDLEGEGYHCTRIAFEMFHYGFVLDYDYDDEEWVLDVVFKPNFSDPECPRKPPRRRRDGGARRDLSFVNYLRRPRAALEDTFDVLYNTLNEIGQTLTAFYADTRGRCDFAGIDRLLRSINRPRKGGAVAAYIRLFNAFAEEQSQGCKDLVQLLRLSVNEAFAYIGPVSSYSHTARSGRELWDPSLFGVAEPAGG